MSGATAAISLAATLAGTAMTMAGRAQQAQSQQAMYGYQAAVARNNQIQSEQMAQDALQRGEVAEQRQRTRNGLRGGSLLAHLAAQGTDLSGSETDIIGDEAAAGELKALDERNAGDREAWGHRVKASQYGADAELAQYRQAMIAQQNFLGRSLIAEAGSVNGKWYRFPGGGSGNLAGGV